MLPKRSLIELEPELAPRSVLTDQIHAALKHRILTCSLRPGQRIIEKDLCEELGISRTPLREALNRLAFEDLVVFSPYRGYAVAPLTIEGFRHLCELRRIIEPETAALAAERATPEDVAQLLSCAETRYTPGDTQSYGGYLRSNSAFHLALVRCSRNPRLESIAMSALDQHQRPCYLGLDVGIDGEASTAEHLAVVKAVRAHNPERARKLMEKHIVTAEQRIIRALQAAGYE